MVERKMKNFKSKEEVFSYLVKTFRDSNTEAIIIKGSTAKGKIKQFSDIDLEVLTKKTRKPYYELALLNNKVFLISVYFYFKGKSAKMSSNVKVLYGDYYEAVEDPKSLKYTKEERRIRDNQLFIDCLFKYIRRKDKSCIEAISKYSRLK